MSDNHDIVERLRAENAKLVAQFQERNGIYERDVDQLEAEIERLRANQMKKKELEKRIEKLEQELHQLKNAHSSLAGMLFSRMQKAAKALVGTSDNGRNNP